MAWHDEYDDMEIDELREAEQELMGEYDGFPGLTNDLGMTDDEKKERQQVYKEWDYVENLICDYE